MSKGHGAQPSGKKVRSGRFDTKVMPYLFISPFYLVFAVIGLFPLLYTAYIATRQWNNIAGNMGLAICQQACGTPAAQPSWYANFLWAFHQPDFWYALRNTFGIFVLSTVPQLIIALFLAAMLSANLRAKTFWRMGVLLPYIIAPMAAGIIFAAFFDDQSGVFNTVLAKIGLNPIAWHASPFWSWVAIAVIVCYRWIGYNTLILLAAMQAIPSDLYEAAAIDGAGQARQFFSVTLPQVRATMMFVVITATIGGMQIFDEPQMFSISTNYGGSNNQFTTMTQLLWKTGFVSTNQSNMGRAAAIAWLLFIIVLLVAALNFLLSSRISSGDGGKKARKASEAARRKQVEAARAAAAMANAATAAQAAAGGSTAAGTTTVMVRVEEVGA